MKSTASWALVAALAGAAIGWWARAGCDAREKVLAGELARVNAELERQLPLDQRFAHAALRAALARVELPPRSSGAVVYADFKLPAD